MIIQVSANSINGRSFSPSMPMWVNDKYIILLGPYNAGATFQYAPPDADATQELRVDDSVASILASEVTDNGWVLSGWVQTGWVKG